MILLTTHGRPLSSALLAGTPYDITVKIDGNTPIFSEWTLLSGLTVVARGTGAEFRLQITSPGSYSLSVKALGSTGHGEEAIFTLPVSSRRAIAPTLSVRWASLQVTPGSPASAVITYSDPEGATATNLTWALYWNNNLQDTGTKPAVQITATQHGVYRIQATATDAGGAVVTANSTLRVSGQFEILPAIVPPSEGNTFQYLGCLYSDTFSTVASIVPYLPFEVASFVQDVVLLPGTTHVRFVLDSTTDVDDEIVIRTNTGNWAVIGPPTGLSTETLIYDYSLDRPHIPAPADRRLAYTIDVWNAHGFTVAASSFRVKVECYYAANPVYEYHRCSYSEYTGGTGERQRRLVAIVEKLDVDLDAVHGKHRGGADNTIIYTTQIPDRLPLIASAQGSPNPQLPASGTMYTEANLVAVYDSAPNTGLTILEAKGVYGLSGLRPYTFTLSIPKEVPIVQRVRRAYGRLAIYLAGGGVNEGSTITVRIKTNALGFVDYTVTLSDFYNPETAVFEKVGEVNIDVSDYGFDIGGLAIYLTIND